MVPTRATLTAMLGGAPKPEMAIQPPFENGVCKSGTDTKPRPRAGLVVLSVRRRNANSVINLSLFRCLFSCHALSSHQRRLLHMHDLLWHGTTIASSYTLFLCQTMTSSLDPKSSPPTANESDDFTTNVVDDDDTFAWTPWAVTQTILLFLVTGIFEIGGGWLVWQAVREGKPWWYALLGSAVLVGYGFWPTLQHTGETDSFGRIYAVYGGFFVCGSFLAGWLLDGDRPDRGDWVGGFITLAGVLVILFWPRNDG